ncbi:hypothetical protein [Hoeflea sp. TYP-13]|uniref:hypothetical protein n=1 Tax=Hoeflea sp. TYP-13 TaxID=3230023 RepID=UPI0034C6919F
MAGINGNLAQNGEFGETDADSLATLLLKLQVELADIAQLIEAAEAVLCSGDHDANDVHPTDVAVIQGMDLAIQKARGLGDFLAELSVRMPQDWLIDTTTALNVITLTDMQQRLLPRQAPSESVEFAKAAGDTELF